MSESAKTPPVRTMQQGGTHQSQPHVPAGVSSIDVTTLAGVVYSCGKVFDGLATGRLDTEQFLRSGSLEGITSRSDLALLEDLRDVSQFIIDQSQHQPPELITVDLVRAVNAKITRSGAIHPGQFRTSEQQIGVNTRHGRHTPDAMTDTRLQLLLADSLSTTDTREAALDLFVNLAKAQPFEDGNKRTALFVANKLLLSSRTGELLTIPVDEQDPSLADSFNDLLARAYVLNEHTGVKNLLREHGLTPLQSHTKQGPISQPKAIPDVSRGAPLTGHGKS
jgi:prophage maintenance system killer protein